MIKEQLDEANTKVVKLQEENENLKNNNRELQDKLTIAEDNYKEYLTKYGELYAESIKDLIYDGWAKTSFGEENVSTGLIGENYFQCYISTEYDDDNTISSNMVKDFKDSLSLLGTISLADTSAIDTVEATFLDRLGKECMTFVLKKDDDNRYSLSAVLGDLERVQEIIDGIND